MNKVIRNEGNISTQRKEKNLISKNQFDFYLLNYYDLKLVKRNNFKKFFFPYEKINVKYNNKVFIILSMLISFKTRSFLIIPIFLFTTKCIYRAINLIFSVKMLNNCENCEWCKQGDQYIKNIIKYKIYKLLIEENKSLICT